MPFLTPLLGKEGVGVVAAFCLLRSAFILLRLTSLIRRGWGVVVAFSFLLAAFCFLPSAFLFHGLPSLVRRGWGVVAEF